MTEAGDALVGVGSADDELRLLVDSATDHAIFTLDRDGVIQSWNEGARRIKGYTRAEAIGQHFSIFYPPEEDGVARWERALEVATREGRFEEEAWRVRKDGSRFLASVVITALRDERGRLRGFGKVTRDVTARRQVEEGRLALVQAQAARREAEARADERAKLILALEAALRARDDFLTVASHELKTPLHTLQMQVSSALHVLGDAGPELVRRRITAAQAQVERLARLIDGLLDMTQVSASRLPMTPEPTDLVALARAVLERERDGIAASGSTVTLEGAPSLPGVWDPLRLDQVLTNLLSNALKYGEARPVVLRLEDAGERVRLSVEDHGLGIAPEDQARLFQRFARAVEVESYSGFGLGLWIVRRIVEAMGGEVRLESARGRGSTFTVELPRRLA